MLVELKLVEQRYQAVLEVLNDGASVTDVARRYGVARQTVHEWLRRYGSDGLGGLADRTSKPLSCPHQMDPVVEARIVSMRMEHPGWGSRTILYWLEHEGIASLPGRTSVDRCLIRHGLITPHPRKRKRSDYKRWERSRSMELWQMDIVGGVRLADGSEAKIVSGIDDHSRFVISAHVVARATARPVCDALELAMARHGVPEQILTDNGKVFTGVCLHPDGLAGRTINFEDWAAYLLGQIRRTIQLTRDDELVALEREVLAYPNVIELKDPDPGSHEDDPPLLVPFVLDTASACWSIFTTLTTFGTPHDVTLEELCVELFFPADDATEALMRQELPAAASGS